MAMLDDEPTDRAGLRPEPVRDGSARNGLERIASLLEEIEQRRELETRRGTS